MIEEVQSVVNFLSNMLRNSSAGRVTQEQVDAFRTNLLHELPIRYRDHWFPENPAKGSAYRCIRINQTSRMDNFLVCVANQSGLSETTLLNALPKELTLWIDPHEVSCRFGEDGSVGMIYESSSYHSESDVDSDSSSDSGSRSGNEDSSSSTSFMSESDSFAYSPDKTSSLSGHVTPFFPSV